jgi:hypothetical protein
VLIHNPVCSEGEVITPTRTPLVLGARVGVNPKWHGYYLIRMSGSVAGGLRQRLRGHQSFQEASLLSKQAATQQTQVQRLSLENKEGFPYIPFKAGYRNGGVQLVPYMVTCYFIGCFNLALG